MVFEDKQDGVVEESFADKRLVVDASVFLPLLAGLSFATKEEVSLGALTGIGDSSTCSTFD